MSSLALTGALRYLCLLMAVLLVLAFPVHAAQNVGGDSTPPNVGIPTLTPSSPGSGDPVTLAVDVNDTESGVAGVTIFYSTDNWASSNNTLSAPYVASFDDYRATMPAQSLGTHVSYYVVAVDAAGNRAVNNNSGSYFSYDVGSGNGGGPGGQFPITSTSLWLIAVLMGAVMVGMLVVFKRRSGSKKTAKP